jgi:hypothetical protein
MIFVMAKMKRMTNLKFDSGELGDLRPWTVLEGGQFSEDVS